MDPTAIYLLVLAAIFVPFGLFVAWRVNVERGEDEAAARDSDQIAAE